jgi:parvulin-like peptidyl-prolyl isomerase
MQKKHIIISCIMVVSIIFSGLALADRQGFRSKQHHQGGMLQMLAAYQQKNLRLQVLSQMTGETVEALQLKLKDQRLRSVLQEFNIDRQAFRDALQAKEKAQIKQAVADGSITAEQENKILTKMENRTKRRELMRRLIEKGIEDGTITRDEARMLMHKGR